MRKLRFRDGDILKITHIMRDWALIFKPRMNHLQNPSTCYLLRPPMRLKYLGYLFNAVFISA